MADVKRLGFVGVGLMEGNGQKDCVSIINLFESWAGVQFQEAKNRIGSKVTRWHGT